MNAHFFDIDVLMKIDNSIWIISKYKPSIPIIKISKSEFNLIKKGIYKKFNSPLELDNRKYWLPENLLNQLKIKCKKHKCDITDLLFSMQEFVNKDVIDNLDYEIQTQNFQHLKNRTDDIYVICSRKSKNSYESIIKKLEKELGKLGIEIKKFYYLSETFYNRDKDNISYKKVKLLLQHLMGLKTEYDKFTDVEITKYDKIYYYDDEPNALTLALDSNIMFSNLLKNSDDVVKKQIKEVINSNDNIITVKQVTHNKFNIFNEKDVVIKYSHITKTFEGFKNNKNNTII